LTPNSLSTLFGTGAGALVNKQAAVWVLGKAITSGKSTVGKLMFSITKAIGKYQDELEESKESDIIKTIEHIYFAIRGVIFKGNEYEHEHEQSRELFQFGF
jgi:hypothetical protein